MDSCPVSFGGLGLSVVVCSSELLRISADIVVDERVRSEERALLDKRKRDVGQKQKPVQRNGNRGALLPFMLFCMLTSLSSHPNHVVHVLRLGYTGCSITAWFEVRHRTARLFLPQDLLPRRCIVLHNLSTSIGGLKRFSRVPPKTQGRVTAHTTQKIIVVEGCFLSHYYSAKYLELMIPQWR